MTWSITGSSFQIVQILIVKVPVNRTDHLQPIDLNVNNAVKEFMCSKFQRWYADEVQKKLDKGAEEHTPADLKKSIMKPLGARWLVSLHDYIHENDSIIKKWL